MICCLHVLDFLLNVEHSLYIIISYSKFSTFTTKMAAQFETLVVIDLLIKSKLMQSHHLVFWSVFIVKDLLGQVNNYI